MAAFGWTGLHHPGSHHHGPLAGVGTLDNRTLRFNRIDRERLVLHLCRTGSQEGLKPFRLQAHVIGVRREIDKPGATDVPKRIRGTNRSPFYGKIRSEPSGGHRQCLNLLKLTAREDIQSAVDRAASNKERVKVVCGGKEIAAVIPLEEAWSYLEELEDRLDVLEALEAIAEAKQEGGIIPWRELSLPCKKSLSDKF